MPDPMRSFVRSRIPCSSLPFARKAVQTTPVSQARVHDGFTRNSKQRFGRFADLFAADASKVIEIAALADLLQPNAVDEPEIGLCRAALEVIQHFAGGM